MPRLYTTLTSGDLDELLASSTCRPQVAFGVTQDVVAFLPDADEEEREHLVTQLAAAAAGTDPVVVAVFAVPDVAASPAPASDASRAPGLFQLHADLHRKDLVCFLMGDPGAQVSDEADLELSWYDATELAVVREAMS